MKTALMSGHKLYVFIEHVEKQEILSLKYPQFPLLSGALFGEVENPLLLTRTNHKGSYIPA